jgi:hypothetical protein
VTVLTVAVFLFSKRHDLTVYGLAIALTWFAFVGFLLSHPSIGSSFTYATRAAFVIGPGFLLASYLSGLQGAYIDLERAPPTST